MDIGGTVYEGDPKMNSRDRNGLYAGGSIQPCSSDREHDSRSNRINTARMVEPNGSGMTAISRPKRLRSTYARMRYAKIVSMLVICATAITVVSAIAYSSVNSEKARALDLLPPYMLEGLITDTVGSSYNCTVTITNVRTGESNITWSDPYDGYYRMDIQHALPSAFLPGDLINVTAINVTADLIGWNERLVPTPPGGSMWLDVTLNGTYSAIPEFPMVIVPVMGMMILFVAVGLTRKGKEQ